MFNFLAINIGFLELRLLDFVEIAIVAVIIYYVYKLIKGSIAFNIFLGIAAIYGLWFLVTILEMKMLETILGQFIGLGLIAIVILFQPEIRRFLLYIGRGSSFTKSKFWRKYVLRKSHETRKEIHEIQKALLNMSITKTGALIVVSGSSRLQMIADTGVSINGNISAKLIETIFDKTTPLHDGAVIISNSKIMAANCTLPVTENVEQIANLGTRHKAAIGMTEKSDAIVFIVSEETGRIAIAENGNIEQEVVTSRIKNKLEQAFIIQG